MNKRKLLLITNIVLLLAFLTQTTTVILFQIIKSKLVFEIHKTNGLVFILALILHAYLNWSWIRVNILKRSKKPEITPA
ncbi:MAG: hypothetical protein NTY22_01380 [Proteobacteria bacterium]|nr:hypothetical protein [Pseudomonadota bacterium]